MSSKPKLSWKICICVIIMIWKVHLTGLWLWVGNRLCFPVCHDVHNFRVLGEIEGLETDGYQAPFLSLNSDSKHHLKAAFYLEFFKSLSVQERVCLEAENESKEQMISDRDILNLFIFLA